MWWVDEGVFEGVFDRGRIHRGRSTRGRIHRGRIHRGRVVLRRRVYLRRARTVPERESRRERATSVHGLWGIRNLCKCCGADFRYVGALRHACAGPRAAVASARADRRSQKAILHIVHTQYIPPHISLFVILTIVIFLSSRLSTSRNVFYYAL